MRSGPIFTIRIIQTELFGSARVPVPLGGGRAQLLSLKFFAGATTGFWLASFGQDSCPRNPDNFHPEPCPLASSAVLSSLEQRAR